MTPEDIAKLFPHFTDAQRDRAIAIIAAAEPLQAETAKFEREDIRRMLQQQVSQLVLQALQHLSF